MICGPASGSYRNLAVGNYSATIGAGCESIGQYSFSLGYVAKSYQPNAIAMGKYVKAQAPMNVWYDMPYIHVNVRQNQYNLKRRKKRFKKSYIILKTSKT